jgi:glycosyltransferase involved in cell wall biosynthesis
MSISLTPTLLTPSAEVAPFPETILLVHNRYRQFGGEDVAFEAESRLLESRGHRVHRFVVNNHRIPDSPRLVEELSLAARTVWSRRAARLLGERVARLRPDVVHVHNFFPLLSPAIYAACARAGAAVVQTLHNYRLICPVATLYRDGHPCEDCVGRSITWPGVLHACYRDSRPATAAVTAMLAVHRARDTWRRDVDMLIAVSDFLRRKLLEGGFASENIMVKPNFVDPDPGVRTNGGDEFLFLGRLSDQKGVSTLLEAWRTVPPETKLRIVGEGPMDREARELAARSSAVAVAGPIAHTEVFAQLATARALIFPSRSYEGGFPLSILEAYATGVPVIASRLGNMAELVQDGSTGLLFRPGDAQDLADKVQWASDHPVELARMGGEARQVYEARFTAEANYSSLIAIYEAAIARRATRADRASARANRS